MAKRTPILYKAGENNFNTLGICKLHDAASCVVEEELNTDYTATVEVPIGCDGYEDLTAGSMIVCKPSKFAEEVEAFEVIATEAETGTGIKKATCRQAALQKMRYIIVGPVEKVDAVANTVLKKIKNAFINPPGENELQITLYSDVEIQNEFEILQPKTLYDVFFDEEEGVLAKFGGELDFHFGKISLLTARGEDRGETVKYGRNLESMTVNVDQSEVVTGVCAYYAKTITDTDQTLVVMGTNKIVSVEAPETAYQHIIAVDCTSSIQTPEGEESDWMPTPAKVEEWARLYVAVNYDGIIPQTVSASVVEDPVYADEREIRLGDTVRLFNQKMGINLAAKIIKTEYNALSDSWQEISIGSVRSNLAQTIVDMVKKQNKVQQVTIGGGNTGEEGYWSWTKHTKKADVTYTEGINGETQTARYGSWYALVRTLSLPDTFDGWYIKPYSIVFKFNNRNDEDTRTIYTYTYDINRVARTMTVRVLTATEGSLTGTLNGTMEMLKNT